MNAKKETAYMFADELLALHEVCPDADITYIANLEERGLPKVRGDASRIKAAFNEAGVPLELIGALDEYGATGDKIGEKIQEIKPDFALIAGVPHAIPPAFTQGTRCYSITNGPRQVAPLKKIGHHYVVVEIDLHPKTLGVRQVIESEFGAVLRSMA
jgi:hypothetical protein